MRKELLFIAGAVVTVLAVLLDRADFIASLHYAVILWLSVSLGGVALLMTHHLSGGRWGFAVRRILEAATAPCAFLGALALILLFMGRYFQDGRGYFEYFWIVFRTVVNFLLWIGLVEALRWLSIRQDGRRDPGPTRVLRAISGPGLVLYFLSVSFFTVDWVMNLEPGWRSTMLPGIIMASQALLALAGATVAAWALAGRGARGFSMPGRPWLDLGTLLFAFVIFWAYVAFSQLLIIWAGNLPGEIVWYIRRSSNGWLWLARAVAAVAFFAPAAVLLFKGVKRSSRALAGVAAGVWVSQAIFLYWVVMPSFFPAFRVPVAAVLVPAGVGAMWSFFFLRAWRAALPLPLNDPRAEYAEPAAATLRPPP